MRIPIVLFALLLSLSACRTQNLLYSPPYANPMEMLLDSAFLYDPHYEYRIQADDKLNISVWGQDDLSVGSIYGIYNSNEVYGKWLLVDKKGEVEAPKIGTLPVAGYTLAELKAVLRPQYGHWLKNPIVDIKVLNKEISVLGEVRNPGVIQVDGDHNTLLEILARAGGTDFYANLKRVKVLRQEGENVRIATIDLAQHGDFFYKNVQLHPGDIVIVPSKGYKEFDKRISVIIPLTSTVTAASFILGLF
jgi:polysaccharide biosynthesis/export protein